ncbi:MAG: hypothetical protein OXC40_03785 [Proteobacteria bacterium]|nr:hypothetical protein [Pseudomonadota bacterium]
MPSKYSCEFLFWLKQLILPILLVVVNHFVGGSSPPPGATSFC